MSFHSLLFKYCVKHNFEHMFKFTSNFGSNDVYMLVHHDLKKMYFVGVYVCWFKTGLVNLISFSEKNKKKYPYCHFSLSLLSVFVFFFVAYCSCSFDLLDLLNTM